MSGFSNTDQVIGVSVTGQKLGGIWGHWEGVWRHREGLGGVLGALRGTEGSWGHWVGTGRDWEGIWGYCDGTGGD